MNKSPSIIVCCKSAQHGIGDASPREVSDPKVRIELQNIVKVSNRALIVTDLPAPHRYMNTFSLWMVGIQP